MVDLALAVGGQGGGPHVGQAAVHVPLYIGDIGTGANSLDLRVNVLPHLGAGEIQHQLVAAPGGGAAGDAQRPVGVLPIELAVLADHLRLNPDAEGHAQRLNPGHQGLQPAGQLFLVDNPVAQAAVVVIPLAKPAVIHDKKFDAQGGGGFGEVHQLVGVKIEVGGFPVVDEHRAARSRAGVLNQVLPDGPVVLPAHLAQAAGRTDKRTLGGSEALAGLQGPAELVGIDSHNQPGIVILTGLHLGLEIAAVQQQGSIAQAIVLVGAVIAEDDKGVVLVAGGAPDAAHPLGSGAQGSPVGGALHQVAAVEGDQIHVSPEKIETQGDALAQKDSLFSAVDHPDGPGNQVILLKNAVIQLHQNLSGGILQEKNQRLSAAVRSPEGGQALQGVLPLAQLTAGIAQVSRTAAAGQLQLDGGQPEVPYAAGGVLLGDGIQGVGPVQSGLGRVGGAGPVGVADKIGQVTAADPGAIVGMNQHIMLVSLHLIGGIFGVQSEDFVFLVEYDHRDTP